MRNKELCEEKYSVSLNSKKKGFTMSQRNGSISVLVVDDSAFMRKSISLMLESDPDIEVVGTARDGKDGIEKVKALHPDLVTLDIEMPNLDGLSALKIIMEECPVPVLMVESSYYRRRRCDASSVRSWRYRFHLKRSFVGLCEHHQY